MHAQNICHCKPSPDSVGEFFAAEKGTRRVLLLTFMVMLVEIVGGTKHLHAEIRAAIQSDPATVITDLHVWQIGVNKFAAIISVIAPDPKSPAAYKELLNRRKELVHVTVEVHQQKVHEPMLAARSRLFGMAFQT